MEFVTGAGDRYFEDTCVICGAIGERAVTEASFRPQRSGAV